MELEWEEPFCFEKFLRDSLPLWSVTHIPPPLCTVDNPVYFIRTSVRFVKLQLFASNYCSFVLNKSSIYKAFSHLHQHFNYSHNTKMHNHCILIHFITHILHIVALIYINRYVICYLLCYLFRCMCCFQILIWCNNDFLLISIAKMVLHQEDCSDWVNLAILTQILHVKC